MKSLNWTQEEIEDLVSNANPFTILGVIIFCFFKDAVYIIWRLVFGLIIAPFLIVVLKGIRWIIYPWCKKDDDPVAE